MGEPAQPGAHPTHLARDWGVGDLQYSPHPSIAEQRLPASGAVLYRRLAPRLPMSPAECCPGTLTKLAAGEVYPQKAKWRKVALGMISEAREASN